MSKFFKLLFKNKYSERLTNGLFKENPTFVLMLGMCPTLAVTTSAMNGVGMGLSTAVVLIASNLIIAALRKFIPNTVRMPYFIVVVASMVTIVQLLLQAYVPSVNEALGIYIPLIVVNCIIFGRVEAYAAKNKVGLSLFDGIGMGLGFTMALILIGSFRELLGAGTIFGLQIMPASYEPITMFIKPPGAFLVLAMLTALQNKFKLPSATNGSAKTSALACGGDCASCSGETYAANHEANADIADSKKTVKRNKAEDTQRKED
ncbi:MAG: electron transport complex subunit E [Clostridiales bacterium]|jgi:electron transport complex protein RnfE|nr:electron transport complex subunit E [Clostridiales bacterium]